MKTGQIVTLATGEQAEILALDSDPTCDVWVVLTSDRDQDRMVARSEIVA